MGRRKIEDGENRYQTIEAERSVLKEISEDARFKHVKQKDYLTVLWQKLNAKVEGSYTVEGEDNILVEINPELWEFFVEEMGNVKKLIHEAKDDPKKNGRTNAGVREYEKRNHDL